MHLSVSFETLDDRRRSTIAQPEMWTVDCVTVDTLLTMASMPLLRPIKLHSSNY
jgi:hypothetical protein